MKPHVKAQLIYLETLRKHGLLEKKLKNELPKAVDLAARMHAASQCKELQFDDKKGTIAVTQEQQREVDQETDAYLVHFGYAKPIREFIPIVQSMPREIVPFKHYVVRSGTYHGHVVKILCLDKELWGIPWKENFGHPVCENFLFRAEKDRLPLDGRFYLAKTKDEDILLHESEIGDMTQ